MKTLWRIVILVALAHQVMSLAIEKGKFITENVYNNSFLEKM